MTQIKNICIALTLLISFNCLAYNHNSVITKLYKGQDDRGKYNIQYPQIKPTSKFNIFNKQLKSSVINDYLCDQDQEKKSRMSSIVKSTDYFLKNNFLSFSLSYDVYCAGAYPNIGTDYRIYYLKQNKPINIDQQFNNITALSSYITEAFYNQTPTNTPSDCKDMYSKEALDNATIDWRLIADGFKIKLDLPHAVKACEFSIKVSCNDLKSYIKTKSEFYKYCQ